MSHDTRTDRWFGRPPTGRISSAGFGLVELMISLVIGLVVIAALVALFTGTNRNNRALASANSVIESGRFAIELLESDVKHAGYWGAFVPGFDDQTSNVTPVDTPSAVPDPCLAYASWTPLHRTNLIGIPVQVYDAASVCGGVVTGLSANSDVLVVRHVDTCVAGDPNCEDDTSGKLYFQSALCLDELPGYVLGVTDVDDFLLQQGDCATPAAKRRFVSHIYFVSNVNSVDANGVAIVVPTLMRSEFDLDEDLNLLVHQAAVPLIEGIEAFRVELGVDSASEMGTPVDYSVPIDWVDEDRRAATNRGDGSPDGAFIRCTTAVPCTAAQLSNVTAVRIFVLARSREPSVEYADTKSYTLGLSGTIDPPADGFRRHVYSTTVRLPNVAGRRARPGI